MARTLQTALQAGLLVPAPTATPRKSPPSRSKVAKSSAPATARSRVLAVRAIPKVTAVAKPPSIIHPVVRFPVERRRGKELLGSKMLVSGLQADTPQKLQYCSKGTWTILMECLLQSLSAAKSVALLPAVFWCALAVLRRVKMRHC